jgi:hypothetical protein
MIRILILQNNKGVFKDVSDIVITGSRKTGIVNYASWNDLMQGQQK